MMLAAHFGTTAARCAFIVAPCCMPHLGLHALMCDVPALLFTAPQPTLDRHTTRTGRRHTLVCLRQTQPHAASTQRSAALQNDHWLPPPRLCAPPDTDYALCVDAVGSHSVPVLHLSCPSGTPAAPLQLYYSIHTHAHGNQNCCCGCCGVPIYIHERTCVCE